MPMDSENVAMRHLVPKQTAVETFVLFIIIFLTNKLIDFSERFHFDSVLRLVEKKRGWSLKASLSLSWKKKNHR